MSGEIYLDWNATTPLHPRALRAMRSAAGQAWGNPSSVHGAGRRARAVVDDAREAVARLLGATPRDVVLTSGGTEANNIALSGARALVTSRLEHPSVVRVAEALETAGRPVQWLAVAESGRIDPGSVEGALARLPPGAVVALMAANHETGVLQPVQEVAAIVRAAGGRLHVDAVQAVGKVGRSAWEGADSVSMAAHKIRGPKGIGALVWDGPPPPPILLGGGQERGIRPGTVDPVAAAGLGAAAARALAGPGRYERLAALRDLLEERLGRHATRNGAAEPRLPHVSSLSFHGWQGDELVAALDLEGVCVSSGSACSAGTPEPSAVLTAMCGAGRAQQGVRVSLGDATRRVHVERAIGAFLRVLARRPSRS